MTKHSTIAAGLIEGLLGAEVFSTMPAAVQRVHSGAGGEFVGRSEVKRGASWLAKLCGLCAGLPQANADTATRVQILKTPSGESWRRQFGSSVFLTQLKASGGLLHEILGIVNLGFRLHADASGFGWRVQQVRVLGLPLPASWFAGVSARSFANEQGYAFSVRASLPLVGFIISYEGNLH